VPCATENEATRALRSLTAFVGRPLGNGRLAGVDRVVVWRDGTVLYLSPGALSLIGYLEPDPEVMARAPAELLGPMMTPIRAYPGPAVVASQKIAAADLPASCQLMLGDPNNARGR
jgi:hypothetical protein